MAVRRLRRQAAHLEITAFINLIVVLVPFLLSTAVFSRLAVIDLTLPAQSTGAAEQLKVDNLLLEVVIRPNSLEVGDRIGGLIQRIPDTAGGHDLGALATLMIDLKKRFPEQRDATVLAEADTSYDALVQVMDTMRTSQTVQGAKVTRVDLFTNLSVGDAPLRKR
jgi:biopolymer transport protein ExbD